MEELLHHSFKFYAVYATINFHDLIVCYVVRFTKDGVLAEGLFWKDVERLIDDYNGERKNK